MKLKIASIGQEWLGKTDAHQFKPALVPPVCLSTITFAAFLGLTSAVSIQPLSAAPATSPDRNAPAASTLIGNFDYGSTASIAFIKDHSAAFVLTPSINPAPGMAAPDDSIHKSAYKGIHFDWGRVGETVVGRLVSDHQAKINFKLRSAWPGFSSQFSELPDKAVHGEAKLANAQAITWKVKTSPAPVFIEPTERFTFGERGWNIGGSQFEVNLEPNVPAYVVAGFGELPGFEGIDAVLGKAEQAYEARRPKAAGPAGDFLEAIADNLNNSRIYSNDNHKVAISVSRGWTRGPNANPYFCWDSFFNGVLACLDDPQMGRDTVRAILSCQTPQGFVPNFGHWRSGDQSVSEDRSQPPVGALCVWKMHRLQPDLAFLREVYPKLAKWHAWWMEARNARHDGLLQWGSERRNFGLAKFETGWDDTPQFEGARMVGATMNAYAVDLNSLWAMDAHYLSLIAEAIGLPAQAEKHRQEQKAMIERINQRLWNEQLGFYCSRLWDGDDGKPGAFLTRLTPMNFYPLICGAPDAAQAKRMLALLTDPEQFWGEWVLPTVSRKDPYFLQQIYWRGTVWGPVNYLVFQGLKRYAPARIQAEFAEKSVRLFMKNWQADGVCGENYLSTTGEQHSKLGRSDSHYTWGALLCLVGLESAIDIPDQGEVKPGAGINQDFELSNVPWGGGVHRVKAHGGKIEIE